ncbi:unnamed protein product, partial [Ectocarpus sp. 12 AP-2014]
MSNFGGSKGMGVCRVCAILYCVRISRCTTNTPTPTHTLVPPRKLPGQLCTPRRAILPAHELKPNRVKKHLWFSQPSTTAPPSARYDGSTSPKPTSFSCQSVVTTTIASCRPRGSKACTVSYSTSGSASTMAGNSKSSSSSSSSPPPRTAVTGCCGCFTTAGTPPPSEAAAPLGATTA